MGKVSIGLRGWRFDEDAVFADDGSFRPPDEIPADDRRRLDRLPTLVTSPCNACWLIHGDEDIEACRVPEVVYGEPRAEVVLCGEHETDFIFWFHERDGSSYVGTEEFQDAFFEWFADGNRAPEGHGGVEHVDTDPESIPDPPDPDPDVLDVEKPVDGRGVDLRAYSDVPMEYPRREE